MTDLVLGIGIMFVFCAFLIFLSRFVEVKL